MAYIQAHKYGEWELYDIYEDAGYSAADLNRPELQRLMSDMRVKMEDIDRWLEGQKVAQAGKKPK